MSEVFLVAQKPEEGKTMANLTITIDDECLEKARVRAVVEGTSVDSLLKAYLESYAGRSDEQATAVREILNLSRKSRARRGSREWRRDELYERG
jgi:hypothetical protein